MFLSNKNWAKVPNLKGLKKPNRDTLVAILGVLVAAIVVGGAIYFVREKKLFWARVDCKSIQSSAESNIKNKKYADAYNSLLSEAKNCGGVNAGEVSKSKKDFDATSFTYQQDLAVSAQESGKKEEAKQYAEAALSINEKLTPEERKQVPNQVENLFRMNLLKNGYYRSSGEQKQ